MSPAFVVCGVGASTSAVLSSASRGGATCNTIMPRRSPTSFISGGGQGEEKTKNSTNRERGSISKAMDRLAESIKSGGGQWE